MADQSVSVSGPVSVRSDSKERVALELAERIDFRADREVKRDREYWLTLYSQCLHTVKGGNVKRILGIE